MVTLEKALLCLQHMEAGQTLEDACFKVSVACKVDYYALLAAYTAKGQGDLPKTRLAVGYSWPSISNHIH